MFKIIFSSARYQNELAGVEAEQLAERFYHQALSVMPHVGEWRECRVWFVCFFQTVLYCHTCGLTQHGRDVGWFKSFFYFSCQNNTDVKSSLVLLFFLVWLFVFLFYIVSIELWNVLTRFRRRSIHFCVFIVKMERINTFLVKMASLALCIGWTFSCFVFVCLKVCR